MHYGHFCYNKEGRCEPGKKYRCVKKSDRMYMCSATLNRQPDGIYMVKGIHTHATTPHCARLSALKNDLKITALSNYNNPEEVFNAASRRLSFVPLTFCQQT